MLFLVNWRHWLVAGLAVALLAMPLAATEEVPNDQGILESPATGHLYFLNQVLAELSQAQVVYLGENHDRPADHAAQLTLIQALYAQQRHLAIALEMFQRPFQPLLDRYIAGELTEADLRSQSQYDERWGFPWEYYAPILRFARAHQIPLIALTAPTEVTDQIIMKGVTSLSAEDWHWIPPLTELDLDMPDYQALLLRFYKDVHQNHGSSEDFDRFFLIQTIWDETMAMGIADFLQRHTATQVVVLAGQGHIVYDFGIPRRVTRRLGAVAPPQRSILLNPDPDIFQLETPLPQADYFWRQYEPRENSLP